MIARLEKLKQESQLDVNYEDAREVVLQEGPNLDAWPLFQCGPDFLASVYSKFNFNPYYENKDQARAEARVSKQELVEYLGRAHEWRAEYARKHIGGNWLPLEPTRTHSRIHCIKLGKSDNWSDSAYGNAIIG